MRRLPVRPNLEAITAECDALLQGLHRGDAEALALWAAHEMRGRGAADAAVATIEDARYVLAREYEAPHWPRLLTAIQMANAMWEDDTDTVRALLTAEPALLHESVLVRADSNWGAPMAYAANLGRNEIVRMAHAMGATDLRHALDRAALQGQVDTAQLLYELAGRPPLSHHMLGGPAYTLNVAGNALLLMLGVRVRDEHGARLAPVDVVLQTDSRRPDAKHAILSAYEAHGLTLPDTPTMALHRGRIDLLEAHLARDPALLSRQFTHREIYPAELGCGDPLDATEGTPLAGTTLLHMAIEFDEREILRWLLSRGADVNARAHVGSNGFGGYTPLYHTVVSQPNFWMNYQSQSLPVAPVTELLLEQGADPNIRASIWKRLHPGHGDPARHEYRDVTPLSWGRRFHAPIFVNQAALDLLVAAGGIE